VRGYDELCGHLFADIMSYAVYLVHLFADIMNCAFLVHLFADIMNRAMCFGSFVCGCDELYDDLQDLSAETKN
jgi:hypothetical protein